MNRKIRKSISKLKAPKRAFNAAVDAWDALTEDIMTSSAMTDDEILALEELSEDEIESVLYDAQCRTLGKRLAKEAAKIVVARAKYTADYIREEKRLRQLCNQCANRKRQKGRGRGFEH